MIEKWLLMIILESFWYNFDTIMTCSWDVSHVITLVIYVGRL